MYSQLWNSKNHSGKENNFRDYRIQSFEKLVKKHIHRDSIDSDSVDQAGLRSQDGYILKKSCPGNSEHQPNLRTLNKSNSPLILKPREGKWIIQFHTTGRWQPRIKLTFVVIFWLIFSTFCTDFCSIAPWTIPTFQCREVNPPIRVTKLLWTS